MRRPGFLAGTDYWFGDHDHDHDRKGKIQRSLVDEKLAEIMAAKIKNGTPLTNAQQRSIISDVAKGFKMKPRNITG